LLHTPVTRLFLSRNFAPNLSIGKSPMSGTGNAHFIAPDERIRITQLVPHRHRPPTSDAPSCNNSRHAHALFPPSSLRSHAPIALRPPLTFSRALMAFIALSYSCTDAITTWPHPPNRLTGQPDAPHSRGRQGPPMTCFPHV
jgi:hypothetical protein